MCAREGQSWRKKEARPCALPFVFRAPFVVSSQGFHDPDTENREANSTMNGNNHRTPPVLTIAMISVLMLGSFSALRAQDLPPEILLYADTILYNAQVLTMDQDQPPITVTQAVALRGDRIQAVGTNDRILQMAGPDTVRVDLGGKTVMPGVVDTHSHPNSYAVSHYNSEVAPAYVKYLDEQRVRFANIRWDTRENALADYRSYARNLPPDYWIYARTFGTPVTLEQITIQDLDEVMPDNPLYVMIGNGSRGLFNSKMLEVIRERYGDRLPGFLVDEQGELNGRINGAGGTVIDQEVIPPMPPEILAPVFKKELEEWVAIGVTTLSTRLSGNEITAYAGLDQRGELPLRLGYSHEIGRQNPFLERQLKRFGNLQEHGTDWMWLIGISIGIPDGNGPPGDSSATGGASWSGSTCTTIPKRTRIKDDYYFPEGLCLWDLPGDPGEDAVIVANRYGYRIAGTHTFGDKGFLMVLDAYAKAGEESPVVDRRNSLDHGTLVSPEVIRAAAEQNVIWSLQPPQFYGRGAPGVTTVFGEEYAHQWVMPVKSLIDAGMKVTYGADVHRDPDRHPMFNLEVLVTRMTKNGIVFGPRERIDRANALLMMTRWGADYVLREQEVGSLEPGKFADLVVLEQNPLNASIADEDLSEIRVVATIIGGEVRYGELE